MHTANAPVHPFLQEVVPEILANRSELRYDNAACLLRGAGEVAPKHRVGQQVMGSERDDTRHQLAVAEHVGDDTRAGRQDRGGALVGCHSSDDGLAVSTRQQTLTCQDFPRQVDYEAQCFARYLFTPLTVSQ